MPAVTASLIRGALREQHPDLAELELREVDGGWGNQMWRLGDDLAVRVQRMNSGAESQFVERRWLPVLAPRLPLPVPLPVRYGEPTRRLPKTWTVMTWVHGNPLDRVSISRGQHAAEALGTFLSALHEAAPLDAPADSGKRAVHPSDSAALFSEYVNSIDPGEIAADLRLVHDVWDDATAAQAWDGPAVWVHGDLHPANVIIRDGTIAGIIDFEDILAGDPALDIASAWLFLPVDDRARFFASYGRADDALVRRARGHAVLKSLFLILMGQNGTRGIPGGKPHWGRLGNAALLRIVSTEDEMEVEGQ